MKGQMTTQTRQNIFLTTIRQLFNIKMSPGGADQYKSTRNYYFKMRIQATRPRIVQLLMSWNLIQSKIEFIATLQNNFINNQIIDVCFNAQIFSTNTNSYSSARVSGKLVVIALLFLAFYKETTGNR